LQIAQSQSDIRSATVALDEALAVVAHTQAELRAAERMVKTGQQAVVSLQGAAEAAQMTLSKAKASRCLQQGLVNRLSKLQTNVDMVTTSAEQLQAEIADVHLDIQQRQAERCMASSHLQQHDGHVAHT
jgi:chromosome segregation ATPase